MPHGDRTGPKGMGQMTGRAAGFCEGYSVPGFNNPAHNKGYISDRGARRQRGRRGYRNRYYTTGLTGWQRAEE